MNSDTPLKTRTCTRLSVVYVNVPYGLMKKYRPITTRMAVVTTLGPSPPNQALTMIAAKKKNHGIVLNTARPRSSRRTRPPPPARRFRTA